MDMLIVRMHLLDRYLNGIGRLNGVLRIQGLIDRVVIETSEAVRNDRIEREEAERKRKEDERLKEERRQRYNIEVERTIELENMALDYQIASRIRAYVNTLEKQAGSDSINEKTVAWIDWALKKADWYDPTVARNDEFFGRREHEKGPDQKALRKAGWF